MFDNSSGKIESSYRNDSTSKNNSFSLKDFMKNNNSLDYEVTKVFNSLISDEDKVAQMIITFGGKHGKQDKYIKKVVSEKKAGGVLLLGGSSEYMKNIIISLNKEIKSNGYIPLLFMTDAEPSLLSHKINGLPNFKPAYDISDNDIIEIASTITKIVKEIGFNMNLAPVCDFPDNKEIIGKRSFGEKDRIIKLSNLFIKETQKLNVIATAKHFPGHGRVKGDSHKEIVYLNGDINEEIEIFKNVIDSGTICIMVGHIAVKHGEYQTDGKPATMSGRIVKDLLRDKLNFKGLIITDAMNMGAVSKISKPSLNAVIAGNDLIIAPSDENILINSVVEKMKSDEIFRTQIYDSVKRILRIKICLGLIK